MSRRSNITPASIADVDNLYRAFCLAARGKRLRPEVRAFEEHLDRNLATLHTSILSGQIEFGALRCFKINDPKPRTIHAPAFRDRVFHHALMAKAGPVLDKALIDDSYACRLGKGALAAVHRAQHHLRRNPWYVKLDIRRYYASIDHSVLLSLLQKRFKNQGMLDLLHRLINGYEELPGRGLPIGSLTSQQLANYYLNGVDRLVLEKLKAKGYVRYMDDIIFWTNSKQEAIAHLGNLKKWLREKRKLIVKDASQINKSSCGVTYCGFRILKGAIRLTARKRRRYASGRRAWEQAFKAGLISEGKLQSAYDSIMSITANANAKSWRQEQLRRNPVLGGMG